MKNGSTYKLFIVSFLNGMPDHPHGPSPMYLVEGYMFQASM